MLTRSPVARGAHRRLISADDLVTLLPLLLLGVVVVQDQQRSPAPIHLLGAADSQKLVSLNPC